MTGVIDQNVDDNATRTKPFLQANDRRDIGKIDLLHHDLDAVLLPERFGESLQPVESPRYQDECMTLLGVLAREFLAEAARCARDENPRGG